LGLVLKLTKLKNYLKAANELPFNPYFVQADRLGVYFCFESVSNSVFFPFDTLTPASFVSFSFAHVCCGFSV